MKVFCVDDEPIVLEEVSDILSAQPDVSSVESFLSPTAALEQAGISKPDAAFLDINMGHMNGLMLAMRLREICPECAIVFVTGYSEYAVEAFGLHANGYLMKPPAAEDVRRELDFIKSNRFLCARKTEKLIRVQCFGNFEVFANEIPLRFERSKTKELMAYLVDRRGANITMGELIAVLWEDTPSTLSMHSNLRNLIHDLRNTLCAVGAQNVLIKERNAIALNCEAIECDFYDFLKRMPYAVNLYRGEYMSQYSWAEITLADL